MFSNANGLRPQSLVRIAGINVGTGHERLAGQGLQGPAAATEQCQAADVTMAINNHGLPIHKDATFAIRPRIFLEGNFFVDVNPGTPSAPVAGSGHTFPIQQGIEPVQFDQVLTSLQSDTRREPADPAAAVRHRRQAGRPRVQRLDPVLDAGLRVLGSIVAHDALGIQPHDLSNWIDKGGPVAGALDAHPQNLENLITDFNTTAGAFARENVRAAERGRRAAARRSSAAIPAFNALNARVPAAARVRPRRWSRASSRPARRSTRACRSSRSCGCSSSPSELRGPDPRSGGHDPGAREAEQGDDPADEERGAPRVELRRER